MTLSDITNRINFYLNTDTNEFTNANRLISLNSWYNKILTSIIGSQDDWDFDDSSITSTYPVATRALVASQRDYKFTTALWSLIGVEAGSAASNAAITPLKIKRVDITYDGTTYYKAEPFDSQETGLGLGNDANTDSRFNKTAPFYDIRSNALWIYPLAAAVDVTAGAKIRIEFTRALTAFTSSDLTTGTLVPAFDAQFHEILAVGPSLDYAVAKQLPQKNDLAVLIQEWEGRLRQWYGKKDSDRKYQLSSSYTDYN